MSDPVGASLRHLHAPSSLVVGCGCLDALTSARDNQLKSPAAGPSAPLANLKLRAAAATPGLQRRITDPN